MILVLIIIVLFLDIKYFFWRESGAESKKTLEHWHMAESSMKHRRDRGRV